MTTQEKMFEKNLRLQRYGPYADEPKDQVTFKVTIEGTVRMSPSNDGVATVLEMEQWLENADFDFDSEKVVKVEMIE